MFVQTKAFVVKEGFADAIINRFSQAGPVEKSPGFVDLSVMVKRARKGEEEVLVMIRWESEAAWKGWETSEAHLEGHRKSAGQSKPEYVISSSHGVYDVKVVKLP